MIKGLAITPPVLGRISIGRVIEKNGKRLPEKDDQFTITTQVQTKDGWILHPLDEQLRKDAPNGKLRSIPVRMLFNDPDLNLRAEYSLFDRQSGRPLCVGNGETCRRYLPTGVSTLPCPSPDACEMARGGACKPYGRLNVRVGEDDELGSFIFRTTGFNSIRVLAARLSYFSAVSGNQLAYLPLELRLRGKSTTQSHRAPIYYVDLTLREGTTLADAVAQAKEQEEQHQQAGICQDALDAAAREGFGNGISEESVEDTPALVEEFFAEEAGADPKERATTTPPAGLRGKLGQKTKDQAGVGMGAT
ncbi:MAG: hydrolase or metal-binding protein [Moraxellaceae bacterium]